MRHARVRSFSSLLEASEDFSASGATVSRSWRAWLDRQGDAAIASLVLGSLLVVGVLLGSVLPASDELHGPYRRISVMIGWTYFCSWSVSFYPQVLLNFRRKTSVGLSFDFLLYNVLAFSCYSAFTCSLYWSKSAQRAYDRRHPGQPNKVQLNDAFFALHATFVSFVTLAQVVYYDWRGRKQRPSFAAVVVCSVILACSLAYAVAVWVGQMAGGATGYGEGAGGWGPERESTSLGDGGRGGGGLLNWLDFLYFLSYIKVVTGILKYVPQVVLNIRRRSTTGWTIWNVILDLTGGLLSVVQLVLDCWNAGDWGGIAGYPVKFAIGFVSVFFDLIFLFQHYVLYPQPKAIVVGDNGASEMSSSAPHVPLLAGHVMGPGGRLLGSADISGADGSEGWWMEEEVDGETRDK